LRNKNSLVALTYLKSQKEGVPVREVRNIEFSIEDTVEAEDE
jgi:hypothetical protein